MKKFNLIILALLLTFLSSCSVISGIFKAGAVTGIIAVVVVLGLIIWLLSAFRGRG